MTLNYSQMKIALRMLQNMIKDGAQNLRSTTQNSVGSILPMTLRRGRRYCVSCFLLKPWWKLCWWKVLFAFLWQEQVSLSLSLSHTRTYTHTHSIISTISQCLTIGRRLLPVVSTGFKLSPGMPFIEQSMRNEEWLAAFLPVGWGQQTSAQGLKSQNALLGLNFN